MLALTHKYNCPFTGAILAGVFTEGALTQLRSLGFNLLFFPYESIVQAFKSVGVDAEFDEDTLEKDFRKKISRWNTLSKKAQQSVAYHLLNAHEQDIKTFFDALDKSVTRRIEKIIVIPLHGRESEHSSVGDAIAFLSAYDSTTVQGKVYKYEIHIRYNNGDKILADFVDKAAAVEFLMKYK